MSKSDPLAGYALAPGEPLSSLCHRLTLRAGAGCARARQALIFLARSAALRWYMKAMKIETPTP